MVGIKNYLKVVLTKGDIIKSLTAEQIYKTIGSNIVEKRKDYLNLNYTLKWATNLYEKLKPKSKKKI